jgi:dTDP-4-dehydrorhamnose reductase
MTVVSNDLEVSERLTVAVVGRSGQLSRTLIEHLALLGHAVVVIARPDADLGDSGSIIRAITRTRPDIVVNAAAYTAVDRAEDEPAAARAVNATGAEAIAVASASICIPIIHISTDYVFDGRIRSPYREVDATGPLNVYGATKLEGELLVAAANPRHVILRTAWLCSPYGHNFVKTMLRLAASGKELKIVGDQYGTPTFATDLADAVCAVAATVVKSQPGGDVFGVFHAVSGGQATWYEFAKAIMSGSEVRGGPHVPVRAIDTSDYPTRALRPSHSVLDTSKLRSVFGVSLEPWHASLATCLDAVLVPQAAVSAGREPRVRRALK